MEYQALCSTINSHLKEAHKYHASVTSITTSVSSQPITTSLAVQTESGGSNSSRRTAASSVARRKEMLMEDDNSGNSFRTTTAWRQLSTA